jgi:PAS domain S-box-containing protein
VQTWNGGARRMKGYDADEIIGRHFSQFYPADQREAGVPEAILESARRHGRHEAEGWRVRKDGTQFWADVVITALRDEDGHLVGFGKVTRDLTSRRLATEQLRAANAELEQFRLLVTNVRDYAIFVLDPAGTSGPGTRGPSASRATPPTRSSAATSSSSTPSPPALASTPRTSSRSRPAKDASRRKAGACARTARCSGPMSSSPRCATHRACSSASPRSRAT